MKTLDEIINRQDYVRVNQALIARGSELSAIFAKKFYELVDAWKGDGLPTHAIEVNGHQYCARVYSTSGGVVTRTEFVRFEYTRDNGHLAVNYRWLTTKVNYSSEMADHDWFVDFLNDAKDILLKLDEVETELVKDAEEAMEKSKAIQN